MEAVNNIWIGQRRKRRSEQSGSDRKGSNMAEREENTSKCMILCDCCGRDITHRMIIWIHDAPFCYECAEKRVKHEQVKTGS